MKKLLLLSLISIFILTNTKAQELSPGKSKHSFIEWNVGASYVPEYEFVFPGTSVLWGTTFINENNFIFEFEVGLALPSLVTGKLGVGLNLKNIKLIVGTRPYPFNFYIQPSFATGEKGYWITSLEYNPFDDNTLLAFYSKALLTVGYRWNLNRDK